MVVWRPLLLKPLASNTCSHVNSQLLEFCFFYCTSSILVKSTFGVVSTAGSIVVRRLANTRLISVLVLDNGLCYDTMESLLVITQAMSSVALETLRVSNTISDDNGAPSSAVMVTDSRYSLSNNRVFALMSVVV